MSSSIKTVVSEYEHVCSQIARLNADITSLKKRRATLEGEMKIYLVETDERGITFGRTKVFLEKKETKERCGKKQRREEALKILRETGVENAEEVAARIFEIGEIKEKEVLKVKRA